MKLKGRYIMVLAALCGATAAGVGLTTNIAGLFFTPIADSFGIGRGSVSLTMTLCNLLFAVGGVVTGRLLSEKRFRSVLIVSAAVTVGATASLSLCNNIWLMYVLNIIRGFSTGLTGVVMTTMVVNNWFHASNGTMTSIVMGCSGLASAVFSPVFSAIIQATGWRIAYLVSAVFMVLLYLPLILLPIGFTPAVVGEIPYGETERSLEIAAAKAAAGQAAGSSKESSAGAKTGISMILVLIAALYATMGGLLTAVVQHFPGVADSYGLGTAIGAAMLSASMIANTSGKIILGILIDHIGVKKGILTLIAAVTAGVLAILFVHQGFALILGAALIGLAYSIATVGVVMMTRETFGVEHYGSVYPVVSLCTTVSYAIYAALIGFIYDHLQSYTLIFWLMIVFIAIAILCVFLTQAGKRRTAE